MFVLVCELPDCLLGEGFCSHISRMWRSNKGLLFHRWVPVFIRKSEIRISLSPISIYLPLSVKEPLGFVTVAMEICIYNFLNTSFLSLADDVQGSCEGTLGKVS
jgi:hypothetical protein